MVGRRVVRVRVRAHVGVVVTGRPDPDVKQLLARYQDTWVAYRDTPEWRRIRKERRWRACGRAYAEYIALWREREQTAEDRMEYEAAARRWAP